MIIFFTQEINENKAYLTADEARHCYKVLRKKVGDIIDFTDGEGYFYKGKLIDVQKDKCQLEILEKNKAVSPSYNLTVAISPVKNPSRFEWFVEKAVEIGINTIVPLICKRTEKPHIKTSRLQKIIVSASKQSLKPEFAKLSAPVSFEQFIDQIDPSTAYMAHLSDDAKYLGKMIKPKSSATILIGPEGDFTEKEIEKALSAGIKPVTLGSYRLRTETAGVAACQIVNTINEMAK